MFQGNGSSYGTITRGNLEGASPRGDRRYLGVTMSSGGVAKTSPLPRPMKRHVSDLTGLKLSAFNNNKDLPDLLREIYLDRRTGTQLPE